MVFFDGFCGLCNASVDFLIRKDTQQKFLYSPLQGIEAKKYEFPDSETLYVWTGDRMLSKSEAWLYLMLEIGGVWAVMVQPFRLLPFSVMNIFYDLVAKFRYKIFGKKESCRIPTEQERHLFLD